MKRSAKTTAPKPERRRPKAAPLPPNPDITSPQPFKAALLAHRERRVVKKGETKP